MVAALFRFQMVEKNAFSSRYAEGDRFAAGRAGAVHGRFVRRGELMTAQTAAETQRLFHKFERGAFVRRARHHGFKGHVHGFGLYLGQYAVPYAQKREA